MMNRIIWHHTGGQYNPNATDRRAYHQIIDGDGQVHSGQFEIAANAPGQLRKGAYAAHTRHLNGGSIGVSIAAMAGGAWSDPFGGQYPVKPAQVDALMRETGRLCGVYGIEVGARTVLSHAEVQTTLGVQQSNKWDFDYDPRGGQSRDPVGIGGELRQEVLRILGAPPVPVIPPSLVHARATIRQGSRGDDVAALQARISATVDGRFGPKTRDAVVRFQRQAQLLADGIVGPMTWSALFPET